MSGMRSNLGLLLHCSRHTAYLRFITDGIVKCWVQPKDYPPKGIKFRSIAGHRHACGIANDASRVYCWGECRPVMPLTQDMLRSVRGTAFMCFKVLTMPLKPIE